MFINQLFLVLPAVLVLLVGLYRKSLWRQMLWSGALSLPIIAFIGLDWPITILRAIAVFSYAALSSVVYELFFSKHFTSHANRSRHSFVWLIFGPLIFVVGVMFGFPTLACLIVSLVINLALVIVFWRELTWDAIFSGGAMAILYAIIFIFLGRGFTNFSPIFSNLSGLTVAGLPIEEVLTVFLFGALWGPLYPAMKDFRRQ